MLKGNSWSFRTFYVFTYRVSFAKNVFINVQISIFSTVGTSVVVNTSNFLTAGISVEEQTTVLSDRTADNSTSGSPNLNIFIFKDANRNLKKPVPNTTKNSIGYSGT